MTSVPPHGQQPSDQPYGQQPSDPPSTPPSGQEEPQGSQADDQTTPPDTDREGVDAQRDASSAPGQPVTPAASQAQSDPAQAGPTADSSQSATGPQDARTSQAQPPTSGPDTQWAAPRAQPWQPQQQQSQPFAPGEAGPQHPGPHMVPPGSQQPYPAQPPQGPTTGHPPGTPQVPGYPMTAPPATGGGWSPYPGAPQPHAAAPRPPNVGNQPAPMMPAPMPGPNSHEGLPTPSPVPQPDQGVDTGDGFSWRRFLTLAAAVLVLAAGAFTMWLVLGSSLQPTAVVVGISAAILPVPFLIGCFLWLGRYNPRPAKYLLFAFGWGACVATAVAVGLNTLGAILYAKVEFPWPEPEAQSWADVFTATTVAPVTEEIMKALGPLLILLLRRKHFTGLVDALMYCGLSAVGFAMVENILYLGRGFDTGSEGIGAAGGALIATMTFIMRILFTGFAHPLFTAMTAIGLGVARRRKRGLGRVAIPLIMLLAAMLLHGLWNLMASLGPVVLLSGYVSVMMPIFFTAVGGALWIRASEARLAVHILSDYVDAGWFSPPEIAALATYRRRDSAKRWARRVAGDEGHKAMREYQNLATSLALLRDGHNRGLVDPQRMARREYALLAAIVAKREVFAGRDSSMPRSVWDGRYYQVQFPDGSVRQVNPPETPVMPIPIAMPRPPQHPGMMGWAPSNY